MQSKLQALTSNGKANGNGTSAGTGNSLKYSYYGEDPDAYAADQRVRFLIEEYMKQVSFYDGIIRSRKSHHKFYIYIIHTYMCMYSIIYRSPLSVQLDLTVCLHSTRNI
jgi:hypothetical protein